MQITKTILSHFTSNCIREKLLLQQSVDRPHFDHKLRPLENLLCSGQPATLVLTDIETGNIT